MDVSCLRPGLLHRQSSLVLPVKCKVLLLLAWRHVWACDLGLYHLSLQGEGGKGCIHLAGGSGVSTGLGFVLSSLGLIQQTFLQVKLPEAARRARHRGRVVGGKGSSSCFSSSAWLRASVITPGLFLLLFRDA